MCDFQRSEIHGWLQRGRTAGNNLSKDGAMPVMTAFDKADENFVTSVWFF